MIFDLLANTPIITDPTPVKVANPPSNTKGIWAVLQDLGFALGPRRPADEQIRLLQIGPLRQLAAPLGTPTPGKNKGEFQLGKFGTKGLHTRGVIVQEGPEFFFAPAGSTDNSAAELTPEAAAGSTQAAMRKQIDALQRKFAAVQESAGFVPKPVQILERTPGGEQLATQQGEGSCAGTYAAGGGRFHDGREAFAKPYSAQWRCFRAQDKTNCER